MRQTMKEIMTTAWMVSKEWHWSMSKCLKIAWAWFRLRVRMKSEAVCKDISIDGCYFDPDKQAYVDADFEVIHVAHDFDPYNRKKQAATL